MNLDELISKFPNSDRRMAVAELRHEVIDLIQASLQESGKNQSDLAEELGHSRSAVSQVLLSDGNLRIATLAEYLHALGKRVRLTPIPLSDESNQTLERGYFNYEEVRSVTSNTDSDLSVNPLKIHRSKAYFLNYFSVSNMNEISTGKDHFEITVAV